MQESDRVKFATSVIDLLSKVRDQNKIQATEDQNLLRSHGKREAVSGIGDQIERLGDSAVHAPVERRGLCSCPESSTLFFAFAPFFPSKAPCRVPGQSVTSASGVFLELASRAAEPERHNPSLLGSDLIAPAGCRQVCGLVCLWFLPCSSTVMELSCAALTA